MGTLMDGILNMSPLLAYILVFLLVFAEDAVFIGFIIPGETAAVLGGVLASQGNVYLWLMIVLVVTAAITGDSVGYEVGKHFGPKILSIRILRNNLSIRILRNKQDSLNRAQEFLRRRGGSAVFLGRFVAFFRAVMPALAGISRMPYRRFLVFNAAGGLVWGTAFVVLGFLAGNSYETVAKTVGRDTAAIILIITVSAWIVWRIRKHHQSRTPEV